MGNNYKKEITKAQQLYSLNSKYNVLNGKLNGESLSCDIPIQSAYYSKTYILHIDYCRKNSPKAFFYNQGIMHSKNDIKIPHCYDRQYIDDKHEYVRVCLYYSKAKEWDSTMYISDTIVPWAVEWIYYYELWRITDKWLGGGIEHAKKEDR